jgi:pimeloyl-ACP methyl ester carboxylesterase
VILNESVTRLVNWPRIMQVYLGRVTFGLLLFLWTSAAHADEAYFDSNGVKIRYLTAGKGEPVILLHGFAVPTSEDQWVRNPLNEPKVLPELAKHFQVFAMDLRGHGKSDKPVDPKQYGLEMTNDVIRLMDHLKLKRAHLVGYSLGAIIAGNLMVTHPDRLISVTLAGGAPVYQPTKEWLDTATALAEDLKNGKGAALLMPVLTPTGSRPPSPAQAELIGQAIVFGQNQQALSAVITGIKDLEVTEEQLRANKVPVLVIYGSREGESKERIDRVTKVLKPTKTEIVKGGDHLTTFAAPKFRNSIRDFLNAHHE